MNESRRQGNELGPLLFVLGLLVGLLAALVVERLTSWVDRDIELVRAVRNLALDEFVSEVDSEELVDDALRGMLHGLDRYSRFYGSEEISRLDRETSGEFRGIGVVFRSPTQDGQILFPFPGSPADRAGLRVGDTFLEIDGRRVDEMEPGELQSSIQKQPGESIRTRVVGLDNIERTVEIQPETVLDPTVRHVELIDSEEHIGYLSILSFTHRTPEEFDNAVSELVGKGVEKLVIDLRYNPGGILDAAVLIANRFIEQGAIVATRTRSETEITEARPDEAHYVDIPVVLLVDSGSASASEVLAGALQDHCVAAIVGEQTYGKGTVQTLRRVGEDRAIVKMTTARYFTPAMRQIERNGPEDVDAGIAPDFVIELEEEERVAIHRFLDTYSPPGDLLDAIESWALNAELELIPARPPDRQLEAAVALLAREDVVEEAAY